MTARTGLLLAAHGARRDPAARAIVEQLATALRQLHLADEVATGYHQGTPGFAAALDGLGATRVVVLPIFTSVGYYTERVLPPALRSSRRFHRVELRQAPPLGSHPQLPALLWNRLRQLARSERITLAQSNVLLVGHGTRRHPRSRDTTSQVAAALSGMAPGMIIRAGFLDDSPTVEEALGGLTAPTIIVVPFLLGGGGHAMLDLPARLATDDPRPIGRRIVLDRPLGAEPGLVDLLADSARRELSRFILPQGSVALVGAGPGDPGLITVRGLALLRAADVVLHDRLAPAALLEEARADAEIIDVGKSAAAGGRSQLGINAALVHHARAGRSVVRLKGGDPFVFGRGAEEADACREAGIPCSVIPGISSAIGVPAAAGIPVTSRGESRSFAVLTAQAEAGGLPEGFSRLARDHVGVDTLVVLMGRAVLAELTSALIRAGRDPATPAACIQDGTTRHQRLTLDTLGGIAAAADRDGLVAPIVVVIGPVAARAGSASAVAASRMTGLAC